MEEIRKLRVQISNIVRANFPDVDTGFIPNLTPPSELQVRSAVESTFERRSI